jgi:hypothetical protein
LISLLKINPQANQKSVAEYVCAFLSLSAKAPCQCSSARAEDRSVYVPAQHHALCLEDLANVKKDQSKDPATFNSNHSFKETLRVSCDFIVLPEVCHRVT